MARIEESAREIRQGYVVSMRDEGTRDGEQHAPQPLNVQLARLSADIGRLSAEVEVRQRMGGKSRESSFSQRSEHNDRSSDDEREWTVLSAATFPGSQERDEEGAAILPILGAVFKALVSSDNRDTSECSEPAAPRKSTKQDRDQAQAKSTSTVTATTRRR